jgi:hypothetical protein
LGGKKRGRGIEMSKIFFVFVPSAAKTKQKTMLSDSPSLFTENIYAS